MTKTAQFKPHLSPLTWRKRGNLELLDQTGFSYTGHISRSSRAHTERFVGRLFLDRIDATRTHSRVVINPSELDASTLISIIEEDQAAAGIKEYDDFSFGMLGAREDYPGSHHNAAYDLRLHVDYDEPLRIERQTLVVVVFDPVRPVGFATFDFDLRHPVEDEIDSFNLAFSWHLLYVMPSRRGEGFGLDLSISCAEIAREMLLGVCGSLPAGSKLEPQILADVDSDGGQNFITTIEMSLRKTIKSHRRKTVTLLPLQVGL